jgi:hypothetical protein
MERLSARSTGNNLHDNCPNLLKAWLLILLMVELMPFKLLSQEITPGLGTTNADKSGYTLFNPTPVGLMREMEALYRNPYTVDAGHVQIETYVLGYAYAHDTIEGADARIEIWRIAPTTLKLGVLNHLDVELELAPYTRVRTVDNITGTTMTQSGFGDLTPRAKYNLVGNDGGPFAAALLPFIKFPTSQDGLGNHAVEGGLGLPIGFELPYKWWLQLSPELSFVHNVERGGYGLAFANTIYFWHSIVGQLSGYIEFSSWVSFEQTSRWIGSIDFGLTYMLTRNIQLDAGVLVGVTRAAPELNPFLGVSMRF